MTTGEPGGGQARKNVAKSQASHRPGGEHGDIVRFHRRGGDGVFWGWAGGLWGRSWVLVRPCWTRGTVGSPGEDGHGRQPTCGQWRVTWCSGDSERVDQGSRGQLDPN